MKRISRILIPIGAIVLLLVVAGIYAANQPLAKGLTISPSAVIESISTPLTQPTTLEIPTHLQSSESTQLPSTQSITAVPDSANCSISGSTTILVLGESNPEPNEQRGADAIRLVKVNFDQKKVTVLSIPSRLVVGVIGKDTITLTYVYYQAKLAAKGEDRARMLAATNALAQAFADHFGYIPQHYITVNQRIFNNAVDTLGGINISIPVDLDGTTDNKGYFKAGEHIFTGAMALDYVRILNTTKEKTKLEEGRFQRQNDVLMAILTKVQKPEYWIKIPQLIEQLHGNVLTDLSPKQMVDFACLYRDPAFQISYLDIPSDLIVRSPDLPLIPINPQFGDFIKKSLQ